MSEDRTKRGVRDLVLSLAVVGAFVVFLYAVVWRPTSDQIRTVDPTLQIEAAQAQAPYPVLIPIGLPADWKTTSARFDAEPDGSTTWFLGYVTPDQRYIAVAQTDGAPQPFIAQQTLQGTPDGERVVAGDVWAQYVSGDQRSLVRTMKKSTAVVTGTVSYDELSAFVQRLSS